MSEAAPNSDRQDNDRTVERIAVVIPALNAEETIGRQIAAVLADRDERTELVLVDNGSTDTTGEVMRSATAGYERVTIVHEPRRGVNRARNAGIAATDAPIILLCDADDEIEPGWINALSAALETSDLVGGAIRAVSHDGQFIDEVGLPTAYDRFGWGIPYGWGCCCGLRRSVWEQEGGFEPSLSGGGDEADFFIRAQIDGARFEWCKQAIVRYSLRADPEKQNRRRNEEGWRNLARCYWFGRLRGWPRAGNFCVDLLKSALLLPLAPFSAHWRSVIHWRMARRWGCLVGTATYLPGEIRRRIRAGQTPPARFAPTMRFRRDWRRIDGVEGWLSRADAAALYAAASRVADGQAIVEIGSWKGRSTTALALGCRRQRTVHAVDPHTGGGSFTEGALPVDSLQHFKQTTAKRNLRNVEMIVARSHDAARTYSGAPIGLLFIDGWHSTEAVLDDYRSWAPHLAEDATIVFDDRTHPDVLQAILELRPILPKRMLEIGKMSVFTSI